MRWGCLATYYAPVDDQSTSTARAVGANAPTTQSGHIKYRMLRKLFVTGVEARLNTITAHWSRYEGIVNPWHGVVFGLGGEGEVWSEGKAKEKPNR